MLLSLLYCDDEVIAAAPACEQQPYGQVYWFDQLGTDADLARCETAVVQIEDPELVPKLLTMTIDGSFDNGREAAQAVEDYLLRYAGQSPKRFAA